MIHIKLQNFMIITNSSTLIKNCFITTMNRHRGIIKITTTKIKQKNVFSVIIILYFIQFSYLFYSVSNDELPSSLVQQQQQHDKFYSVSNKILSSLIQQHDQYFQEDDDDNDDTTTAAVTKEKEENNNNNNFITIEFEKSLKYIQSLQKLDKQLISIANSKSSSSSSKKSSKSSSSLLFQRIIKFVHIPKTAGTGIEEIGGKYSNDISWGSCLFNHKPKRRGNICHYPNKQFEWPMKIGWWHIPTKLFPIHYINPYIYADLFVVIRNPYDRLISEFYYLCRKKVSKWWNVIDCNSTLMHNQQYLNDWLIQKLYDTKLNYTNIESYLNYNGHFTPQYDFIIDKGYLTNINTNTNSNRNSNNNNNDNNNSNNDNSNNDNDDNSINVNTIPIRRIDYVLYMENLNLEFDTLMDAYNIPISMPIKKFNSAYNIARNVSEDLKVKHLYNNTLQLIQTLHYDDIHLLNYTL